MRVLTLASVLAPLALAACDSVEAGADAMCAPTWANVLANAGFDDGHQTWTEEPAEPPSICGASQVPFAVDSPEVAACLGTDNNRVQTLTQTVELPAGATRVRLVGKRCLITGETGTDAKDSVAFEVRNADTGATVAELGTWSNKDARETCDWVEFELDAALTATPRRAELRIRAVTDDLNISSFYLDTLQLEALACR